MNSIQEAREHLKLSRQELGVLLGGSEKYVVELESLPQSDLPPTARSLSILLKRHGNAQVLVECRINTPEANRDALSALARKLLMS